MKIMTVAGTRPEIIKLAPVVLALRERSEHFEVLLCATGQHREMFDQTVAVFGLVPDVDLDVMVPDQTLGDLTSALLPALDHVLRGHRPDLVLVQGDTTSAMATALAAFYQRLPVGHVEAGLRTNDRYNPFPEEINRRLISALSTWHYAPTARAVDSLIAENVPPKQILQTGNTVVDALHWIAARSQAPEPAQGERVILVTAHRRENFGEPLEDVCRAIRVLVERNPDVRVIYPVHMNPKVRSVVMRNLGGLNRIDLIEPVSYPETVRLLRSCYFVLTDSGGIQEEAPVFGKPVLVMRETSERPEGVEAGVARLVGTSPARIVSEAQILLDDSNAYDRMSHASSPYGDGHAAERIRDHLLSLTATPRASVKSIAH